MNTQIIKTVLIDQKNDFSESLDSGTQLISRSLEVPIVLGKAQVITGIRRSGKSVLCRLISKKYKNPLVLSFFDDRLDVMTTQDLGLIMEAFHELHDGQNPDFILLDEIQIIPKWEMFVNRLLQLKVPLFITGSSAKLLSKEIATELRGRSIKYELFPFSFLEYLHFHQRYVKNPSTQQQAKIKSDFKKYLEWGGFPEIQDKPIATKRKILHEYIEVLLFRDLVERNKYTNVVLARRIFTTLIRQYGNLLSINQTHKKLKAQGLSVEKATISDFIRWMEDAYVAFAVYLFTESEQKARVNPFKFYVCDAGLIQTTDGSLSSSQGRRFENIIFCALRARSDFKSLHYFVTQAGHEVDFIYHNMKNQLHLYQVCWDLNSDSMERETRALSEAMHELKIKSSTIITLDQNQKIKVKSGQITVIDIRNFLLYK